MALRSNNAFGTVVYGRRSESTKSIKEVKTCRSLANPRPRNRRPKKAEESHGVRRPHGARPTRQTRLDREMSAARRALSRLRTRRGRSTDWPRIWQRSGTWKPDGSHRRAVRLAISLGLRFGAGG